jgi:lipopolysaccharide/colanic/teichoic acid biosynthesis glycosyltransferase
VIDQELKKKNKVTSKSSKNYLHKPRSVKNMHNHIINDTRTSFFKRSFDIFLAGLGLIFSSWLWSLIWIMIIIEDGFPVLIRQERMGKYGKIFKNFKFRSMSKRALHEEIKTQARENDTRVTNVGRLLRKCAMDELPQLLNIFKGDMSFVGPRALLPAEREVYTNGGTHMDKDKVDIRIIPGYKKRITVQPGLTGIAQIYAPRYITRRHKFKYDLLYIRKRNFWLDIRLIILSFIITFCGTWERSGLKLAILRRKWPEYKA